MTALLQSVGVAISRREIQRRLTENRDVLRAGLQTSPWISVDDTGARHKAKNGFCTPIGNRPFTWFGPRSTKSRLNVLDLPRAGHTDPAQRPPSATAGARPLPRSAGLKQAHAQGFAPVTVACITALRHSMKQAEIPELTRSITGLSKASSLGPSIRQVEVEPGAYEDGAPYLRVWLHFDHNLEWDMVELLVTSIEDSAEKIDDRYPSGRLADAASVAGFVGDLLAAAERLLGRRTGQRGRLSGARIRRSLSTTYYDVFHFMLDEVSRYLIGTHNDLRRRRRTLSRVFTQAGIRMALDKVRWPRVDPGVADLLRPRGAATGAVVTPDFAMAMARVLSDMQALRHKADYNLNREFTATEAEALIARVREVIATWHAADPAANRYFKHALSMRMLLRGQLRRDG